LANNFRLLANNYLERKYSPFLFFIAMKLEYRIRVLAGVLVLLSVTLAHYVSAWWLFLAVFVGLNLIQSAFTGFCPAEKILTKIFPGKP
jgi:hypothetical protein